MVGVRVAALRGAAILVVLEAWGGLGEALGRNGPKPPQAPTIPWGGLGEALGRPWGGLAEKWPQASPRLKLREALGSPWGVLGESLGMGGLGRP